MTMIPSTAQTLQHNSWEKKDSNCNTLVKAETLNSVMGHYENGRMSNKQRMKMSGQKFPQSDQRHLQRSFSKLMKQRVLERNLRQLSF